MGLNRRTLHRTIGAKYTAVARLRAQHRLTLAALIVKPAGIRGHHFPPGSAALWAGQHGLNNNNGRIHRQLTQRLAQYALIDAPANTASGQLAVDDDRRHTLYAMLRGPAGNCFLMHVMNDNFML